tara:strand:- start:694 stop:954 length:261 start_codon:yes stop_codon:yes gene_type:complete
MSQRVISTRPSKDLAPYNQDGFFIDTSGQPGYQATSTLSIVKVLLCGFDLARPWLGMRNAKQFADHNSSEHAVSLFGDSLIASREY